MADSERVREALRSSLTGWAVLTVSGDRAQVLPAPDLDVLVSQLDHALGREWSVSYAADHASPFVVRARLALDGVEREGLATGHTLSDARLLALADAMRAFGVAPAGSEAHWVEYDAEEGANTHELEHEGVAYGEPGGDPESGALPPQPPADPQLERAKQHLNDLIEQLGAAGMGKQAARIITLRGGYGSTVEESREIYRELKALQRG